PPRGLSSRSAGLDTPRYARHSTSECASGTTPPAPHPARGTTPLVENPRTAGTEPPSPTRPPCRSRHIALRAGPDQRPCVPHAPAGPALRARHDPARWVPAQRRTEPPRPDPPTVQVSTHRATRGTRPASVLPARPRRPCTPHAARPRWL